MSDGQTALCRTGVQLTMISNKIGVLEKLKVRKLSKNPSCAAWREFCVICIIYYVTVRNCNIEISNVKLPIWVKNFPKQKSPKEVSRNFQVPAQEKQVKYDVKLHDFFLKKYGHLPHLRFTFKFAITIPWYHLTDPKKTNG